MNKKTKIVFHLYYSDWSCSPSSSTITICDYTPPGSLFLHALASECTRISYIRACQYISFPPSSPIPTVLSNEDGSREGEKSCGGRQRRRKQVEAATAAAAGGGGSRHTGKRN